MSAWRIFLKYRSAILALCTAVLAVAIVAGSGSDTRANESPPLSAAERTRLLERQNELLGQLMNAKSEAEKVQLRAEMKKISDALNPPKVPGTAAAPSSGRTHEPLPPAYSSRGTPNYHFDPKRLCMVLDRDGRCFPVGKYFERLDLAKVRKNQGMDVEFEGVRLDLTYGEVLKGLERGKGIHRVGSREAFQGAMADILRGDLNGVLSVKGPISSGSALEPHTNVNYSELVTAALQRDLDQLRRENGDVRAFVLDEKSLWAAYGYSLTKDGAGVRVDDFKDEAADSWVWKGFPDYLSAGQRGDLLESAKSNKGTYLEAMTGTLQTALDMGAYLNDSEMSASEVILRTVEDGHPTYRVAHREYNPVSGASYWRFLDSDAARARIYLLGSLARKDARGGARRR